MDVAANCRSRCEQLGIPYYRFDPVLDEDVSTFETDDKILLNLVIKVKTLLQNYNSEMDELIQHLYSTSI